MALIDLANPTRFVALVERVLPWLIGATVIAFAIGLRGVFLVPDDYQQGATVKIMYIHVPNAWLSMFVWGMMSAAALGTLVWRHPLADVAAKAAAPIGAAFTLQCLITGSLWGRPMWGTYWVWDGRLTSVLVLFFLLVRATLSVEKPGPVQQIAEMLHGFVSDQAESIIGHGFERFVPIVTTIFVFILLSNLLGLLPGFISPTAKPWRKPTARWRSPPPKPPPPRSTTARSRPSTRPTAACATRRPRSRSRPRRCGWSGWGARR